MYWWRITKIIRTNKTIQNWVIFNDRVEKFIKKKKLDCKKQKKEEFMAPNIIIAGGVGSFEPKKFLWKVKNLGEICILCSKIKIILKIKIFQFLGGDSALDWALELSNFQIHYFTENNLEVQNIHYQQ